MKTFSIILSFLLVLALGACSGNSQSNSSETPATEEATSGADVIDINRDKAIVLGSTSEFDNVKAENIFLGGSKITFYSGDKQEIFRLREKYDFDEYRLSRLARWEEKYREFVPTQMNRFDVYSNIERKLIYNPYIKGIALQLSNGAVLVLMSFKENPGVIKRTIIDTGPSAIFNDIIEGNEDKKETCQVEIYFKDYRTTCWYVLPVYHPTKTVAPEKQKKSADYQDDELPPITDEAIVLPSSGKPEIRCESLKDENSRIIVKGGGENGSDKEFIVKGKFDYNPQKVHYSNTDNFTDEAAGAAFLDLNGKMLLLLQLPEDAASVKKIRTKYTVEAPKTQYLKYDCPIRARIVLDNRRGSFYEVPVYLPQ